MDNLLQSTEIGVLFLDLELNIRKFTLAATRAINVREGDVNRPLTDFSHNLKCPPHQENCYNLVELLRQVLRDLEPKEQEMLLHPSGEYLLMRVNPYWSEKGECQGLVLSFIDIHQVKQAEENLRQRSDQLRLITNAIPAWISYVDELQYYRFSNEAYKTWFGGHSEEIEGLHLSSVLGDAVYQQVLPYVEEALSGQNVSFDIQLPSLDRGPRWVNVSYISHILESNQVKGFFTLVNDISDRKTIERMKDEFISVVSHELRTPLTSILGSLKFLSNNMVKSDSEQGRKLLTMAHNSTVRLVSIVNDILELEHLESGKLKLSKQRVNTADLLAEATEVVQAIAAQEQITFNISNQDIDIYADSDRLVQVLTNLLSNAIKFSEPASTIWLGVERKNNDVLFAVKDRGRGIPKDKLNTIFERFQQVDATDSRHKGGTGLGLSICHQIVEQHKGRIWADSTLGEGSSFYFTVPIEAGEGEV